MKTRIKAVLMRLIGAYAVVDVWARGKVAQIKNRGRQITAALATARALAASAVSSAHLALGAMWLWLVVSLVLLALVALVNPAKLGVYGWLVSKLSMAAVLGFGFDRAAFPESRPSQLEGIERVYAQTRRGTVIAATLVAAGLMP